MMGEDDGRAGEDGGSKGSKGRCTHKIREDEARMQRVRQQTIETTHPMHQSSRRDECVCNAAREGGRGLAHTAHTMAHGRAHKDTRWHTHKKKQTQTQTQTQTALLLAMARSDCGAAWRALEEQLLV